VTGLVITGTGCLSPAATARLARLGTTPEPGRDVTALYPEPLPSSRAHAIVEFDPRQIGLKGAAFRSRAANMALVACRCALDDSGLRITDANRRRVGAVIGSGEGSFKAASDYTAVTLTDLSPRHGSAALFPSTVANHTAAQCAIHHGLQGINTTIASSRLALLRVLRYSATMLRRSYADAILAGVAEEFTPQAAWLTSLAEPAGGQGVPAGEGAAIFVVESAEQARANGRHVDAELLAVVTGFDPDGGPGIQHLESCLEQVVKRAGLDLRELSRVVTDDEQMAGVLDVPAVVARVGLRHAIGECRAASGGLLMAGLLALHRDSPQHDGQYSLLVSTDRDGGVGAAVIRAWSRPSGPGHHGGL
jgi:3-oxoacyl-[acyl-carrier-protein] synthase II